MRFLKLVLLSLCLSCPALADGISISPILIEAPANGGATSLTIGSNKTKPINIQVRVVKWTQDNGVDVYTPTNLVRFSPEIFSLETGQQQVVRMLLPDTEATGAWRVIIDELPSVEDSLSPKGVSLGMRLRYMVPMFAAPEMDTAEIEFDIIASEATDVLRVNNPTNSYARIFEVKLGEDAETAPLLRPALIYVLPSSEVSVDILGEHTPASSLSFQMGSETYTRPIG